MVLEGKYITTTDGNSSSRLGSKSECSDPPDVSNANYEPRDSYPEETEIYYNCKDGYNQLPQVTNRIVCAKLNDDTLQWLGEQIQCQSSTALSKK